MGINFSFLFPFPSWECNFLFQVPLPGMDYHSREWRTGTENQSFHIVTTDTLRRFNSIKQSQSEYTHPQFCMVQRCPLQTVLCNTSTCWCWKFVYAKLNKCALLNISCRLYQFYERFSKVTGPGSKDEKCKLFSKYWESCPPTAMHVQ